MKRRLVVAFQARIIVRADGTIELMYRIWGERVWRICQMPAEYFD